MCKLCVHKYIFPIYVYLHFTAPTVDGRFCKCAQSALIFTSVWTSGLVDSSTPGYITAVCVLSSVMVIMMLLNSCLLVMHCNVIDLQLLTKLAV